MARSLRSLLTTLPALDALLRTRAAAQARRAARPSPPDPARRMMERLEAQRRIERHISEQLDLPQLLTVVVESALQLIEGTGAAIYRRDGDMLIPRAWTAGASSIRNERVPVGSGSMGKALATRQGVTVNDYRPSGLALADLKDAA